MFNIVSNLLFISCLFWLDRLNILENNFAMNQSTISKTLKRLEKKFDYQLSANGIQVHIDASAKKIIKL